MQNDAFEVECPICGSKAQQPCRDERTLEVLRGGFHVGRITRGLPMHVYWDETSEAFKMIEN